MPGKLIAALSVYSIVLVAFFLTGTPPLWAFVFGLVACVLSYAGGLEVPLS
ncbi:MAG: hypothetical protein WB986_10095 [Methanoregula sp.]|jgi:hypothetical protein|uniref:hypothetical protein n=1 Tax=Methanoregula sp. TaxID=2052170 RepID=UPI003C6685F6